MKYLWEVSKNLICEPEKVFVNKETKCCYYLNRDIDKRFYKFENIGSDGLVAYNKWCFLFNSKENAEKWHKSKLAKQKDKNIKIINSNAYHYLVDFIDRNSMYSSDFGDIIHSMALIRELDRLMGKEEPKQAKGE